MRKHGYTKLIASVILFTISGQRMAVAENRKYDQKKSAVSIYRIMDAEKALAEQGSVMVFGSPYPKPFFFG